MVFSELFERFTQLCPASVMHRALLEHVFSPARLDAVFHRAAQSQYQRTLLFSTVVSLTSQVVCRITKSVHASYLRQREQISVSVRALYDKLNHIEVGTSRALVQHTARAVGELIDRTQGGRQPLLKGYRTRILDGNHLGKTQHRLQALRGTSAGALPGQTLVLLDPQRMLIDDVVPCEDGHAQERSLLDQVLAVVEAKDLLIADRNFCTLSFLFGLLARKASFVIRQHGRMPYELVGKRRFVGRCDTGRVYEQAAQLHDKTTGKTTQVRRITLVLKSPTRDGDRELHLLTNLPPARASAVKVAQLYRQRWTLEQAFNVLTTHLRCELNTLGYPQAALFAFCVAVCSYNFLAAVKGVLRGVHGERVVDQQVSNFYLTDEINTTYSGMMVALPPETWVPFQSLSLAQLAVHLRRWAAAADLSKYPKHARGPKKPKTKRPNAQFQHVSTTKLIAQQRSPPKTKPKTSPKSKST